MSQNKFTTQPIFTDSSKCVLAICETMRFSPSADDLKAIRAAQKTLDELREALRPMEKSGYITDELNRRSKLLAEEAVKNPAGIATAAPRDLQKEITDEVSFRFDRQRDVQKAIALELVPAGTRVLQGFIKTAGELLGNQNRFEKDLAEKFGAEYRPSNVCGCIQKCIETAQGNLDGIAKGCDVSIFKPFI